MLQRAGLAQALINDPKLVILDEPLGGMDPIGRKEIRDIIVRFKDEGRTVFFTSHILQDIEMICDRVAIIVGGRIVKEGALRDLVSERVLFTEAIVAGLAPEAFAGPRRERLGPGRPGPAPHLRRIQGRRGPRPRPRRTGAASCRSAPGPRRSRTSSSRR